MPRTRGSFNNPNSFEVAVSAPLDARQRVDLDADLINPATWITGGMDYSFEGMLAYSEQSKAFWLLTALPATVKSNWKQIGSGSSGDPTEIYKTTATLSAAIGGSTTIGVASVGKQISDIFVDRTMIYDVSGTVGVATAISGNDFTVTTVTASPGLRQGVRLGSVDTENDLPGTVSEATAIGLPTPVAGDYVNVRQDSSHGNKLAQYLVQAISDEGIITWFFDHTINDSDYQEQSKTIDSGKILVGGATQGTFGTSIDPTTFVKGVQFNGTDLTQDTDGKVNVQAVRSISVGGAPQTADAQGNVNLPDFVKTISVDGNNVAKDENGNVNLTSDIKTISVGGVNVPKDLNGNVDLPEANGATYVVRLSNGNITVSPETNVEIPKGDVVAVFKGSDAINLSDFLRDVTGKDVIYIHGTDGAGATNEFTALFVQESGDNLEFNVLVDNKGGSNGGQADGTYFTTTTLDTTANNQTTVPFNTVSGHRGISKVVVNDTMLYDIDGTMGVVTSISGTDLIVRTATANTVGTIDYEDLENKPQINSVELTGDVSLEDLGINLDDKQDKLTPGENIEITEDGVISSTGGSSEWGKITGNLEDQTDLQEALDAKQNELTAGKNVTIEDDTISVADSLAQLDYDYLADEETLKLFAEEGEGGTSDYTKLINKPQVNSIELDGNKSLEDLGIQGTLTAGTNITIEDNVISATGGGGGTGDYEDLENKPTINGVELIGDKTSAELDIFSKVDYEYEEEGGRLLLLADAGPGKELTVEHKTGETFGGKPVYGKMFTITPTTISANSWTNVPISRSENNIDFITSALAYDVGSTYSQVYPFAANANNNSTDVQLMHFRTSSSLNIAKVYLTYTKK